MAKLWLTRNCEFQSSNQQFFALDDSDNFIAFCYSPTVEDVFLDDSPHPHNNVFALIELENFLHNPRSKVVGMDRINNEMINKPIDQNCVDLLYLINQIFIHGYVSDDLKTSIILPIHKFSQPTSLFLVITPYHSHFLFRQSNRKVFSKRIKSFVDKQNFNPVVSNEF